MTKPKSRADVIIVSHNNRDILAKLLDSLKNQSYKNFKTYLLDNDSNDGTSDFIQKDYPWVNFIDVPKTGPSKKRNIGIEQSDSEYIITLDSDVVLTKDWIKIAMKYMDKHPDVGICGSKLTNKKGFVDSAGGFVSRAMVSGDIGHEKKDAPKYDTFKQVSYVVSAAAIMRREMIDEIGGFDEDYFYSYEDTDLGLRANLAGWKVIYNPDLIGEHLFHATVSRQPQIFIRAHAIKNRIMTLLKSFEVRTILFNSLIIIPSLICNAFNENIKASASAYFWILKNWKKIMEKRRRVFHTRKITDKKLFQEIWFPLRLRMVGNNRVFNYIRQIKDKSMRNLFFFVTTHCNSRCKHCFYWKSLHKTKNLTLKQIEDIFSKFHNIHAIVLSGGEPFIRQDLDEVIKILVKYTDAQFIFIPTNCLVDITDRFEKILKENSHVSFVLCASLDGLENEHDYIRGVPGGFKKTVDLIKKLAVLKKSYPNFKQIVVNTVITNKNYDNLEKFMKFVRKLPVTFQAFDIIRGDHQKMIGPPTVGKLKKINRLRYKANKNHTKKFSFFRRLHQNMKVKEFIRNQNRILDGKPWPFPCMAGTTDFVIESDGSARICELQPKIGSLLKNRPEDLLQTKEAKEIFKKIKNHECDCTHTCITGSSMERSLKNIFWTRVWGFLKPLPKK